MKSFLLICAAFCMSAIPFPLIASAQDVIWNIDRPIEYSSGTAQTPHVAIAGEDVLAVWRQHDGLSNHIYANYSPNGGSAWAAVTRVDSGPSNCDKPRMDLSEGNAIAVWLQVHGDLSMHVYANLATITDESITWDNDMRIDSEDETADNPQVSVYGSNAVAVWLQEDADGDYRVYANHATIGAGSITWHGAEMIEGNDGYTASSPQIALIGNNAVAVWRQHDTDGDYRVYANHATIDAGSITWHGAEMIEGNDGYSVYGPQVAMSGNNVVAVWRQSDGLNSRIYANYATIDAGSITWDNDASKIPIENNSGYNSRNPQISMDGNNVVAVWCQESPGGWEYVYANHSANHGITWNPADNQRIDNNDGYDASIPQVSMWGKNVVAVWVQYIDMDDYRIYSNFSTDSGASWIPGNTVLIEDNDGFSAYVPQVSIYGNRAVAVWRQEEPEYSIYSNYARFIVTPTSSGSCFASTIAAGTPLAKNMDILRQFRDRFLLANRSGQRLVSWYYSTGQSAAAHINAQPIARLLTIASLYLLSAIAYLAINGASLFLLVTATLGGYLVLKHLKRPLCSK